MYVCVCNAITDKQIRKAAKAGVTDLYGLQRQLGVATGCGSCKDVASEILRESHNQTGTFEPVVFPTVARLISPSIT